MPKLSENILPVYIEEEMRNSYIDYSMSVIVSRALPDVRDGLKPVHRRVLYGMLDLGLRPTSAYKKSARIVGEVLGKYHPHGDKAVYDTMVRMVQDFSLRYPLVDGQGNFGSIDGDSPAAMRYTEARLAQIAEEVLRDIDKDTVDFVPNFDESLKEPAILPSLLPSLVVNGASGIAVGMATNIPPHNLNEVVNALAALIDNPALKPIALKEYIKGPDFPTGAVIIGDEEINAYFKTGRGRLTVRAKVHVEDMGSSRQRIVITEIPYQVNKTTLLEKVASLVREKKIEGIQEIRDESDREGMRVVFELRKEASSDKILNNLFKHTQMQATFGVILLALVDGQPRILNLKEMLTEFLQFRHDVVLRRTKYELDKAEKRAHILEGLKIALDNIDAVIALIKKSRDVDTARRGLMKTFKLSEIQAQAILDMRLQRLTGLERKKIEQEYLELIKLIEKLKSLLASKPRRMQLVKEELLSLRERYGDARRTQILGKAGKSTLQELMKEDETLVAVTNTGVIKRIPLTDEQAVRETLSFSGPGEFTEYAFKSANSHYLLIFTNSGHVYSLRTSFIPTDNNGGDNGTTCQRLLRMGTDEKILNIFEIDKFEDSQYIFITTKEGLIKKSSLSVFSKLREGAMPALTLKEKDEVVSVTLANKDAEIIIATRYGQAIRFSGTTLRDDMGITAGGVRGISLAKNDQVVGMITLEDPKACLLSMTNLGYGKKTDLSEYSLIGRGGKGMKNYNISDKVGKIVTILEVNDREQLLFITKKGRIKKQKIKLIKKMGRATQGIPVINLAQKDEIEKVVLIRPDKKVV
ncbi:DNA gyrase subunit A [candidate division KSB1 bacterium]|nr:DNA gyrase subunit A [candidate division KSB1 bacterium]